MPSLNTGNAILSNAIAVNSSYNVGIGGAASGSFKLQVTGSDILVNGLTIGEGAGSIGSNTVVGASALPVNTTGTLNTAIGNSALLTNTTGYGNTSVGYSAIGYNTTGFFNAGVGVNALLSNTTGTYNNALGTAALYANTTGSYNTAVGQQAGTANTTGSNNTYIGYSSGLNITTGSNNTIIGNFAGSSALANNIVLADGAGNVRYQWDGTNNVFTGAATFSSSVQGNGGVYSGTGASAATIGGKAATASGLTDKDLTLSAWYPTSGTNEYGGDLYLSAGRPTGGGSGKYGTVYIQAGIGNGTSNVAGSVGTVIAANNTLLQFFTATTETASPTERMRITSGGNVIVGNAAYAGTTTDLSITGDKVNSDGFYSRLIFQNSNQSGGSSASIRGERVTSNFATELTFYTNPTGSIGSGTERMRITSGGRVLIGVTTNAAGGALAVASNGVVVYDGANYRQMYQSSSAMYWFNGSNEAYLSSAGVWTNASDISIKKDINDIKYGLNEVMKLKPKSYKMIDDDLEQIGFIAQDVEELLPELVGTSERGMKGLSYGNLTAVLTKAIQELNQKVNEQQQTINSLINR